MTRTNLLLVVVLSLVLGLGAWGVGAKVVGALAGTKDEQQKPPPPPIISGQLPDGAWAGDSDGGGNAKTATPPDPKEAWKAAEDKFNLIFAAALPKEADRHSRWETAKGAFTKAPSEATTDKMKKHLEGLLTSVKPNDSYLTGLLTPEETYAAETNPDALLSLLEPRDGDEFRATVKETPIDFVGIAKVKCWFAKSEIPETVGEPALKPPFTAKITDFPGVSEVSCLFPTEDQWKAAFALGPDKIADMHLQDPGNGEYLQGGTTVIGESKQATERAPSVDWNKAWDRSKRIGLTAMSAPTVTVSREAAKKQWLEENFAPGQPYPNGDQLDKKQDEMTKKANQNSAGKGPPETFSYRWVIEPDAMKNAVKKATITPP